jgi:hypothetical protein
MFVLRHDNVDGYPSVRDKWDEKPTKEQLLSSLIDYHSNDEAEGIADDLISYGDCSTGDSDCTVYTLEEI